MGTPFESIANASAMPAATWHFLKANDTTLQIPANLAALPQVQVRIWREPGQPEILALSDSRAFEQAMADAQRAWEQQHPLPSEQQQAAQAASLAADADATYGGTAQSAYQKQADALEAKRSLAAAFQHGTGSEAAAFLQRAAGGRYVIEAQPGEALRAQAVVTGSAGTLSVAAIDVVARQGSQVSLSLVVSSESTGRAPGAAGTTVRVFAGPGARVDIVRTQALNGSLVDIDDTGLFAADNAQVRVQQTQLGGTSTFTGLAGDLRGSGASIDAQTRYLGHGTQELDFNYMLRHHGPATRCNLQAQGVLADASRKTLRGTIDFVRGCKGAEGSENETVLLVDERARNTTVPVLLCNEDDVSGNHGATIGHVRGEQLFYLASRGLDQAAAEWMFVGAFLERAAIEAPDEETRQAVLQRGECLSPGFAQRFEED